MSRFEAKSLNLFGDGNTVAARYELPLPYLELDEPISFDRSFTVAVPDSAISASVWGATAFTLGPAGAAALYYTGLGPSTQDLTFAAGGELDFEFGPKVFFEYTKGSVKYHIDADFGDETLVTFDETTGKLYVDLREFEIEELTAEVKPPNLKASFSFGAFLEATIKTLEVYNEDETLFDIADLLGGQGVVLEPGDDPAKDIFKAQLGGVYKLLELDLAAEDKLSSDIPAVSKFLKGFDFSSSELGPKATAFVGASGKLSFDTTKLQFSFDAKLTPASGSFGEISGGLPAFANDETIAIRGSDGRYVTSSTGTPFLSASVDLDFFAQSRVPFHLGSMPDLLEGGFSVYNDGLGFGLLTTGQLEGAAGSEKAYYEHVLEEAALRLKVDYTLLDVEAFAELVPEIETTFLPTGLLATFTDSSAQSVSKVLNFDEIGEIDLSGLMSDGTITGDLSLALIGDRSAALNVSGRAGVDVEVGKFELEAKAGPLELPVGKIGLNGFDRRFPDEANNELFDFTVFQHSEEGVRLDFLSEFSLNATLQVVEILGPERVSVAEGTRFVTDLRVEGAAVSEFRIAGGQDAALFDISADGRLFFRRAPDFETPRDSGLDNDYEVQVIADGGGQGSDDHRVIVAISDRPEDAPAPDVTSRAIVTLLTRAVGVEGTVLTATVSLDRPAPESGTLAWSLTPQSAEVEDILGGASGPLVLTGTVVVPAGATAATLEIPTSDDADFDDEALVLRVTEASGGIAMSQPLQAQVMILDTSVPRGAGPNIEAEGSPDFVFTTFALDRKSVDHDGFALLTVTIANMGDVSGSSDVGLFFDQQTGEATAIGVFSTGLLDADQSVTQTIRLAPTQASALGVDASFDLPSEINPGRATVQGVIDPAAELASEPTGNNISSLLAFDLLPQPPSRRQPNLVVQDFDLDTTSLEPGETAVATWTVVNPGILSGPSSKAVTGHIILSTPQGPVSLAEVQIPELANDGRVTDSVQILLGSDLPVGAYEVSLVLDPDDALAERNEDDNTSLGVRIVLGGQPNVSGSGLILPGVLTQNTSVQGSLMVENTSASKSYAGYAKVLLSDDTQISVTDTRLTQVVIPELDPGESATLTFEFYVYEAFAAADYSIGVLLDDVPGDANSNDNIVTPVKVTVESGDQATGTQDLALTQLSINQSSVALNGGATLSFVIANVGFKASDTNNALRLLVPVASGPVSEPNQIGGGVFIPVLQPGETYEASIAIPIGSSDFVVGANQIIGRIEGFNEPQGANNGPRTINLTVKEPTLAPADGAVVPGWENGRPDYGVTYDLYDAFGGVWDIDRTGSIYRGGASGDSGGFDPRAFSWIGFRPNDAIFGNEGRSIIMEGALWQQNPGLVAQRQITLPEGSVIGSFLDSVTNTTDETISYTFQHYVHLRMPQNGMLNLTDGTSNNYREQYSATGYRYYSVVTSDDTHIKAWASRVGDPLSYPGIKFASGENGFHVHDAMTENGTGRIAYQTTYELAPGETASFLQFANLMTQPTATGPTRYDMPLSGIFDNSSSKEYLLSADDLAHVRNWDVTDITEAPDLSLTLLHAEMSGATLHYDAAATNSGDLTSDGASILIVATDAHGNRFEKLVSRVAELKGGAVHTLSGSLRLDDVTPDGTFNVSITLVADTVDQISSHATILLFADAVISRFTPSDDAIALKVAGSYSALDGNDTVTGTAFADTLSGAAGNDLLRGGDGDDALDGGLGTDILEGGTGDDRAHGDGGDDAVSGGDGDDLLDGGIGADVLFGDTGADTLLGGQGDDTLIGGQGADVLEGGDGDDLASYATSSSDVWVSLAAGTGFLGDAADDQLRDIEHLEGSDFNDRLIGDDQDNRITGGNGDDLVDGGGGADTLAGGVGDDTVSFTSSASDVFASLRDGGTPTSTLTGFENIEGSAFDDGLQGDNGANILRGGLGNDVIVGEGGADTLDGGAGDDLVDYIGSATAVSVTLNGGSAQGGSAQGDVLIDVEFLRGSTFDDTLIGDSNSNVLDGQAGADLLDGGDGSDILIGGLGDDTLISDGLEDALDGGPGVDQADFSGAGQGVNLSLNGDPFATSVRLLDIEDIVGSAFDDQISGGGLANHIVGGEGNDTLEGGDGNDTLSGDAGADLISAGDGNDIVRSGDGSDTLNGGIGNDTLSFESASESVTLYEARPSFNAGAAQFVFFSDFEALIGSDHSDFVVTNGALKQVFAGEGDDSVWGTDGLDSLYGDAGADSLSGGLEGDLLDGGAGSDTLLGDAGDDTLIAGGGADYLDGGTGFDLADYSGSADRVVVDLLSGRGFSGDASGDSFVNIEAVFGSKHGDALSGGDRGDFLLGGNGDDHLLGLEGGDTLLGGAGHDTIEGGLSHDAISGGTGDDLILYDGGFDILTGDEGSDVFVLHGTVSFSAGLAAFNSSSGTQTGTGELVYLRDKIRIDAVVDGGNGIDTIQLSDQSDAYFLHDTYSPFHESLTLALDFAGRHGTQRIISVEEIRGLGGDDVIDLTSPDYSLAGVAVSIDGGDGNDLIWGSDANESITGGNGNDTIFGGIGTDVLTGGEGADVFEFTRTSTNTSVTDFDINDGDMLRFYNAGGAEFDSLSVVLTANGIQISYLDTAFDTVHNVSLLLATDPAAFTVSLPEILDALEIL